MSSGTVSVIAVFLVTSLKTVPLFQIVQFGRVA
uniref:Uncharacterized protein n=1 Tax=Anguilla anguilla TaxID=7936 RepID=A0A0E9U943_ANGAN